MKWVIHTNLLDGSIGNAQSEEGYPTGKTKSFRILDDDGIVYFKGVAEFDKCDTEEGLEPLDEFGAGWGCTEIQYREETGWKTL